MSHLSAGKPNEPMALSDRLEALRLWWANYAHDGVVLTPELIARQTSLLNDLRGQAGRYEDLMSEAYLVCLQHETDRIARRGGDAIRDALEAKGLSDSVMPAAQLLTAEHFREGNVSVFTKPFGSKPGGRHPR